MEELEHTFTVLLVVAALSSAVAAVAYLIVRGAYRASYVLERRYSLRYFFSPVDVIALVVFLIYQAIMWIAILILVVSAVIAIGAWLGVVVWGFRLVIEAPVEVRFFSGTNTPE